MKPETMAIKVCGLTRSEDAQLALNLGAFALGFIFYEKSPRFVRPELVRSIIESLPKGHTALLVGVFVDADPKKMKEWAAISGINTIQLHGDEGLATLHELRDFRVWKAFRLKSAEQLSEISSFSKDARLEALLIDAAVDGQYGGTGHSFDAELVSLIPREKKLILAGGLHAGNVRAAWDRFHPYALDLSSGVESSPGIKDPEKLRLLFAPNTRG